MQEKRDMWWIPSQQGDPDQLEAVRQKLDEELSVRFRPGEASLHYERDQLVMRLPARIEYTTDGRPMLTPALRATLAIVAGELRREPDLHARINADVPSMGVLELELRESSMHSRMVYDVLRTEGVATSRLSLWGWGSSRPISRSQAADSINRGITIDLVRRSREEVFHGR